MREFEFIKQIKKNIKYENPDIIKGIGDDCAIINFNKSKEKYLIITSDSLFENVHFNKDYFKPWEIGARSMAVNVSDICAMGGIPLYALVNIGYPGYIKQSYIDNMFNGINDFGGNYGVEIIGGDTISAGKIFLSITLIGEVEKGRILRRDAACAGDSIFITGTLGDSYAGFRILANKKNQRELSDTDYLLIKKHILPTPRYVEGRLLAESGLLNSCIDVSDGIISDITRISEESNLGAEIYAQMMPISTSTYITAKKLKNDPIDYALYGGEDYELLFTVNLKNKNILIKFADENNIDITEIGKITARKGIYVVKNGNKKKENYKKVWKHF